MDTHSRATKNNKGHGDDILSQILGIESIVRRIYHKSRGTQQGRSSNRNTLTRYLFNRQEEAEAGPWIGTAMYNEI